MIAREQETKLVISQPVINQLFNSAVTVPLPTFTNELYSCIPDMGTGINSYQRVGDKLNPKSVHIKGSISLSDDDASADVTAFMYVFTCKKYKTFLPIQGGTFVVSDMLKNGRGGTTNPDGQIMTSFFPANDAAIRILKYKEFKLQKGSGHQQGQASETGASVGGGSTTIRKFNIKIPTPHTLVYDEVGGVWPTNYAPVVCFGYYHNDGVQPDFAYQAIRVNMQCQMYYDDA